MTYRERIASSTHFGIGTLPDSQRATVERETPRVNARPDCVSPASVRSATRVSVVIGEIPTTAWLQRRHWLRSRGLQLRAVLLRRLPALGRGCNVAGDPRSTPFARVLSLRYTQGKSSDGLQLPEDSGPLACGGRASPLHPEAVRCRCNEDRSSSPLWNPAAAFAVQYAGAVGVPVKAILATEPAAGDSEEYRINRVHGFPFVVVGAEAPDCLGGESPVVLAPAGAFAVAASGVDAGTCAALLFSNDSAYRAPNEAVGASGLESVVGGGGFLSGVPRGLACETSEEVVCGFHVSNVEPRYKDVNNLYQTRIEP